MPERNDKKEEPKKKIEGNSSLHSYLPNTINWHRYNLAKTKEKHMFYRLLYELCSLIKEPPQITGRPRARVSDVIFCLGLKLYANYSGRRISSDLLHAEGMGYIKKAVHYNTLFDFLSNESMYDWLKRLLEISALPLKNLEDQFSIDASGFGSYQYERWINVRFKRKPKDKTEDEFEVELGNMKRNYLKGSVLIGTRTHIICSADVTYGNIHDSKAVPTLLKALEEFKPKEVSADMGYSSYRTHQLIESLGATPFIPFQDRHNPKEGVAPEIWIKMHKYFNKNKEDFLKRYHKRSNVETVFSMIKVKLGEILKCKSFTAQRNELMMKFICHNICCLITEIFESNVHVDFKNYLHKLAEEKDEGKDKTEKDINKLSDKDISFENL